MKPAKTLLSVRAKMKKHQPLFVMKEHHKSARIKRRWRAQRGIHSGHRQMYRGKPAQPTPGFGVPKAVHGLHSSGLQPVLVHTPAQLEALNSQTQGIIIGSTVGMKKKMLLLMAAAKKNISVLQVKDISAAVENLRSSFIARTKVKKDRLNAKSRKEAEKKKKAEEKKKEGQEEKQKKKEETAAVRPEEKKVSIESAVADKEQEKKEKEQQETEKMLIKPHKAN